MVVVSVDWAAYVKQFTNILILLPFHNVKKIILQMKDMDMEVSNISRNVGDPKSLLKRFYELQTERVQTYKMFEEGFQAYLNSAPLFNFPLYRQLVHEITQTFLKISQEIVEIGTSLRDVHHLHTIASNISKIQEREQSKLDLTAGLQLSRQLNKDHPDDVKFQIEITETQANLMEVVENINEILEDIKYESEDLYLENYKEQASSGADVSTKIPK